MYLILFERIFMTFIIVNIFLLHLQDANFNPDMGFFSFPLKQQMFSYLL